MSGFDGMNDTLRPDDLDRLLGEWLAEGPGRTPEPVLRAAVDHARAHPRRPDPFAALRRDPMAGSRGGFLGLAPVPAFALLALLLAAALGVALVGSRGTLPPIAPGPVVTSTPRVRPSPTAPPSTSPSAPASPVAIRVTLETGTAATMTVDVTDASGTLAGARSGNAATAVGQESSDGVSATNVDPTTVELLWIDAVCDAAYSLSIEQDGTTMTLGAPSCTGDAMALPRVLLLEFSRPVRAAGLEVTLVRRP